MNFPRITVLALGMACLQAAPSHVAAREVWADPGGDCTLALQFMLTRSAQPGLDEINNARAIASDRCSESGRLFIGYQGQVLEMHRVPHSKPARYRSRAGDEAVLRLGAVVPVRARPDSDPECRETYHQATLELKPHGGRRTEHAQGVFGGGCP